MMSTLGHLGSAALQYGRQRAEQIVHLLRRGRLLGVRELRQEEGPRKRKCVGARAGEHKNDYKAQKQFDSKMM